MAYGVGVKGTGSPVLPIVFVGPSMPLREAREIVEADFRAPCRRGDLAGVHGGAVVGLIDGVFRQDDAVSPREIVYAMQRGVTVFGSSSMGALRAVEVPGMQGVGRVYEMFKRGTIDGDDEVAVLFDPDRLVPLTVPLVNVRYAVERLVQSGTIRAPTGRSILAAAKRLHYTCRTYRGILHDAGLDDRVDAEDLLNLLNSFDLKRDDARLLLERLAHVAQSSAASAHADGSERGEIRPDYGPTDGFSDVKASGEMAADAPVLIWETGDSVRFPELVLFLKLTGRFESHARTVIARRLMSAGVDSIHAVNEPRTAELKTEFHRLCRTWGWRTGGEVQVTLTDLGLGFRDVLRELRDSAIMQSAISILARSPDDAFLKALRCELFFDDMALKREVMRYGSLKALGTQDRQTDATADEASRRNLSRLHGVPSWERLQSRLINLGLTGPEIQEFIRRLSNARAAASSIGAALTPWDERAAVEADARFGLQASPKPPGEPRFSVELARAYEEADRLKGLIGVTRVGMITGLAELEGVQVSQAARPAGVWSSSYGAGKSDSKEGAVVGAIMEETEKWAQERFTGDPISSSYAGLRNKDHTLDPRSLDLPYDSVYQESLEFSWHSCPDLIQGRPIWVPLPSLACSFNAGRNNIFYSARGGRITFSTNGLASGFSLAEALVHATCEYIERHAARMSELRVENPGLGDRRQWPRRIGRGTLPESTRALSERLERVGCQLGVWDITSEIRVPTFLAQVVKDREAARGWAAHPDPAVAAHMALMEAVQTFVAAVAGGREDLTVQARSLGRHERSKPLRASAHAFWQEEDQGSVALSEIDGLRTDDVYREFLWIRQKLIEAGLQHLIALDLTRPEMLPACAVRVILPGLETNNPYYCGPRARFALLSDMLPRDR